MSVGGGMLHRIFFRLSRILTGKAGIYGKIGHANHFAQGVLVYEDAEIGHDNYFAPYTLVNNCRIGNYCSIGPGCKLGLGEHDMTAVSTCPRIANGAGGMKLLSSQTVIEHDVWLGANVVVRQGVHIGTGAVVGSGAVVTKDIPPYAVVTGVPAKLLRYRFSPHQIETLLASQWFLKEKTEAKQAAAGLQSILDTEQEEGT